MVTGAGRGIGRAMAEALARLGASVAVNDIVAERAEETAALINDAGGRAAAFAADVGQHAAVLEMAAAVEKELGPADLLVNNAGIPGSFPAFKFVDSQPSDWEPFLRVNLYGVLHCCHAFAPAMKERGWGRVVTISSEAWRMGTDYGISMYAAGKAGAIGFMRQLASELGRDGVTANCISLGELDNLPLPDDYFARYPVARAGSADDVVALLLYLVSDEAAWMTGQVLPLNGGLS